MSFSLHLKDFISNFRNEGKRNTTPIVPADLLEDQHKYELTENEISLIFKRKIYKEVIKSSAFQRLKKIHFLGAIDYVIDPKGPKPNKRHTRYQHSLGVARLALQFSRERQLTESEEILCVVSALLHDIGHPPLSHSLESVFKQEYGIGHHIISERIIRGDVPIGHGLHKILLSWNINPFEILEIIHGTGPNPYREIFSYAINIDTIEAILRSSTYVYKNRLSWQPSEILNALLKRDVASTDILDSFWRLKDEVYNNLINHKMGILADYVSQQYMRNHRSSFIEDYYYATEPELMKKHRGLFDSLKKLTATEAGEVLPDTKEIIFLNRWFNINKKVTLESIRSVDERYTQTRSEEVYSLTNN